MKKLSVVLSVIVAAALLLTAAGCFLIADGGIFGIRSVRITENKAGELELVIGYLDISGYRVKLLEESDVIYFGERPFEGREALGECIVSVTAGDCGVADALARIYPMYEICRLEDVPDKYENDYKLLIIHNASHGISLYVGSAGQMAVTETSERDIISTPGSIRVRLN